MSIMPVWVGALPYQLSLTSRIVLLGIRKRLVLSAILSVSLIGPRAPAEAGDSSQDSGAVVIDAPAPTHPFPHFWYFEVWNEPNLDFWAGDPK